ncbi:MAG: S8 family serine peptidase, partial [Thermofilaceae archaeon]
MTLLGKLTFRPKTITILIMKVKWIYLMLFCYACCLQGSYQYKIAPSLQDLLQLGQTGERILIIVLHQDSQLQVLQQDYIKPYVVKTMEAFNSPYIQAAIKQLTQFGELSDGGMIRHRKGEKPQPGPVYIFYLNAVILKAPIKNIPLIAGLPVVRSILDGEIPLRATQSLEGVERFYMPQQTAAYEWENLTDLNWGFKNMGGDQVKAWIPRDGSNGIFVSIIDTGFDEQHPLTNWNKPFANGKFNIAGVSYYWSDLDAWDDSTGHGTAVAGCVWQFTPNSWFYIHEAILLYQVVQSFQTAREWNAQIIITSLSPGQSSCPCVRDSELCQAATGAADLDTLVISAAGNCVNEFKYPVEPGCCDEEILSVSSIRSDNSISTGGSPCYSCGGKPDLAAPGSDIFTLATVEDGLARFASGSSFAAPHLAGAAALVMYLAGLQWSIRGAEQVREALLRSAIDLNDPLNRDGKGRAFILGALGILKGNDQYPNPEVIIENVLWQGSAVTFRVRLKNYGERTSRGNNGVFLRLRGATFDSVNLGSFNRCTAYAPGTEGWKNPRETAVRGAEVIELYCDGDEAESGIITVVPHSSEITIFYRGWIRDMWDTVYNKWGQIYEFYIARFPDEYPVLKEGEVETGSSPNPPYSRHIGDPTFSFVDYSCRSLTIGHTVSPPSTPQGLSSGCVGNTLTFSTGGASCALGHALQYQFDWGDGNYSAWISSTSASYMYTHAGTYQVRARARCASDTSIVSTWSPALTVKISAPPSVPPGISASDGTFLDRVRISWSAVSGAAWYEVYRSFSREAGYSIIASVTGIEYNDTNVIPGQHYWYTVKACNECGCSAFSSADEGWAKPNSPPVTPGLVSPADGATGLSLTPTLQASAFSDPDGDAFANSHWQVDNNSDFSSPEWDSGESYSATTQVTVPAGRLAYSTTYWWRVRYKDSRGAWSNWSPARRFTTQAPP